MKTVPRTRQLRKCVWTLTGSLERDGTPQTVDISRVPFRIGRRPELELSIFSPVVSGFHAELIESGGVLCLRDVGSTNGTFVNGRRITTDTLLSEGDWIEIGTVHLKVDSRMEPSGESQPVHGAYQKTSFFDQNASDQASRGLVELIEKRLLQPCFQPIHNVSDRDIHGYEFLARSQVNGVSNPGMMFEAAKNAGREVELSMLCREQAVEHSVCLPSKLPLFLNTHPNEPLLEAVVPQLGRLRKLSPQRPLVLEIHEGAVTEPGLVRELRSALQAIDVRLAFDDFGAGQARIRELICAPSDYIKFDAALIRDLQDVSEDQFQFFKAIISGVGREGVLTVAEGIETPEMIGLCERIGFDLIQGYAMSSPTIMYPDLIDTPTVRVPPGQANTV